MSRVVVVLFLSAVAASAASASSLRLGGSAASAASLSSSAQLPALTDVFTGGKGGYACYRIPALLRAPDGKTLLLFAEGRRNSCNDHGFVDLVMKASADGGATWGALSVVRSESTPHTDVTIGNPAPVVVGADILLPFCRNNLEAGVLVSSNGGASWALKANLTLPPSWDWIATGPPGSLRLAGGRILIPANHNAAGSADAACVFISDDDGASWRISSSVPGGNEDQAVALTWRGNSSVLLSMRAISGGSRLAALSTDGGATFGAPWPTIPETECEASTIALPAHAQGPALVMSSAFASTRANMTLHTSRDDGHTWHASQLVYPGSSAYSSLVADGDSAVALAFERDNYQHISFAGKLSI